MSVLFVHSSPPDVENGDIQKTDLGFKASLFTPPENPMKNWGANWPGGLTDP